MSMLQKVYDLITTWQRTYGEPIPLARLAEMAGLRYARTARRYVRRLIALKLISPGLLVEHALVTQKTGVDAEPVEPLVGFLGSGRCYPKRHAG